MTNRIVPYIGVTGFTSVAEVQAVLARDYSLPPSRNIMIGVLASTKSLRGEPTSKPRRSPPVATIRDIFASTDERCLNFIHYHPSTGANWVEEAKTLMEMSAPHAHGIQLNTSWPNPRDIASLKASVPNAVFVLQVKPPPADPSITWGGVIHSVAEYAAAGLIDHVLIDASRGDGTVFDPYEGHLQSAISEIRERTQNTIGIGVAGGLWSKRIERIRGFFLSDPLLSWDAEGALRTTDDDALSIGAAVDYLHTSSTTARAAQARAIGASQASAR